MGEAGVSPRAPGPWATRTGAFREGRETRARQWNGLPAGRAAQASARLEEGVLDRTSRAPPVPSNVRDAIGRVGDIFLDPFNYVLPSDVRTPFSLSRLVASGIDTRSRNIESLDEIERTSIDFYVTIRSLYRQHRAAEILNGEPAELAPAPDIAIELEDDAESKTRVSTATGK